jgi:hypothetical protein
LWLEVNEQSAADDPPSLHADCLPRCLQVDERSAAAVLSRVPADLPHLERVRLRAGSTLYGDLLIAQPIHLYAEEGVQLVGQLRLDGGSSRGSGSSHKANFYKWDEPPARGGRHTGGRHTGSKLGKSVHAVGGGARTQAEEELANGGRHGEAGSHNMARGEAGLVARAIEESRLFQIVGVIEGLSLGHYMEPAIRVQRGRWKLVRCQVAAKRKGGLASTAIDMKESTSLSLLGCSMQVSATEDH